MKKTFNYQSDANFYDKKDFIIAVLKSKINRFKEYDAERKSIMLDQNKKSENQNPIQMNQKMDLVQNL